MVYPAHLMVRTGKETRMVMIGQLIHCALQRGRHKPRHIIIHGSLKILEIAQHILAITVAVLLHPRKEPRQRFHKSIVIHHSVPLVAAQPFHRVAIMLGQHNRFWISLLDGLAEILPEFVVKFYGMP